jgi:hypothetical protein
MKRLAERAERHDALRQEAHLRYALFEAIMQDYRDGDVSMDATLIALRDVIDEMQGIIARMRALIGGLYRQ